ncbi:hypothetical protein [Brachyspira hyodysenteriae]|uniref:hypothetical protein n=1 Tax=Brachyspira hyodysenteriae TaxID=159 RepID=UPI00063DCFB0|nr:hypothetical protein [Brachyspira hyodysenteriae]KLI52002.1 hypothetical protein SZ42_05920 [Brachyspira hyodysenteriae]QTM08316.1 hypothetical protein GQX60_05370 [Brachyspira hyodysenteriae]
MLNSELMNFVLEYSNGNLEIIYNLLKNDCKMDIKFHKYTIPDLAIGYLGNIIIKNKKTLKKEEINIIDANDMLSNIFDNIDDEALKRLEEIFSNRENLFYRKSKDTYPSINLDVNNSNTNTNVNNNSNTSDIKTYSDLRLFVENNSNIENKTEIVNLIRELEEAKDDENKEDYIDKFLKLLELLENVLPIPPAIIKGAKTAKKFFDSIKNNN